MLFYQEGTPFDAGAEDQRVIIPHIVNNSGAWGAGFVMALSRLDERPEKEYLAWIDYARKHHRSLPLGEVQFVDFKRRYPMQPRTVANMVAQAAPGTHKPIRYVALRVALEQVRRLALQKGAAIHMPRIGAGLAGGEWEIIGSMLERIFADEATPATVWTPKNARFNNNPIDPGIKNHMLEVIFSPTAPVTMQIA